MCDTIGIIKNNKSLFGKNSDRSPNESQVIQFIERHKTKADKVNDITDVFQTLRLHTIQDNQVFCKGSVSSICMHAGGIVGDHTTSSFVVELTNDDINVWFTGTSCPCIGVFKYWKFGTEIQYPICTSNINDNYWKEREKLFRSLIGFEIPNDFYKNRAKLEKYIIENKEKITLKEILDKEKQLYDDLKIINFNKKNIAWYFKKYWSNKSKELVAQEEKNGR